MISVTVLINSFKGMRITNSWIVITQMSLEVPIRIQNTQYKSLPLNPDTYAQVVFLKKKDKNVA